MESRILNTYLHVSVNIFISFEKILTLTIPFSFFDSFNYIFLLSIYPLVSSKLSALKPCPVAFRLPNTLLAPFSILKWILCHLFFEQPPIFTSLKISFQCYWSFFIAPSLSLSSYPQLEYSMSSISLYWGCVLPRGRTFSYTAQCYDDFNGASIF